MAYMGIILKWVVGGTDRVGGANCVILVQDKNQWQAVVSVVMNNQVPQLAGTFLTN
jgi:hypothetical protein